MVSQSSGDQEEYGVVEPTAEKLEAGAKNFGMLVDLKDSAGKELVNAVTDGPWMILDLAPGAYTVTAEVRGISQSGRIEVSGNSQKFGYMFRTQ